MTYLVQYDRRNRKVIQLREFEDAQRREADAARLALELELNRRGENHEVVLLDAAGEEALHITHGRYFKTVEELIEATRVAR